MKLLIDADYIAYKACASAEYDMRLWKRRYFRWFQLLKTHSVMHYVTWTRSEINSLIPDMVLFFSDATNFRKTVAPSYKGHRNRKKPCGYKRLINALRERYEVIVMPDLEADDALGIYATSNDDCVIVSPDKDMKQIPGKLYNLEEHFTITPAQGWQWFLIQTLAGDSTDGYSGAPGYGVKTSAKFFEENGYTWNSVLEAFGKKGLTEADALMNARLAKILTADDYNGRPILFTPSDADHESDNGAGVQDEATD